MAVAVVVEEQRGLNNRGGKTVVGFENGKRLAVAW